MIRDFVHRLNDPRIRRPILGAFACFAVWLAVFTFINTSNAINEPVALRGFALALTIAPLVGVALSFIVLHRRSDEVERAMQNSAAATGFVAMMLTSAIGLHLEAFGFILEINPPIMLAAGLLGWIAGLLRAWTMHR